MPALNKFKDYPYQLARGKHNLEADVLKIALTNSTPLDTFKTLSEITQVSGGSYPSGGFAVSPQNASRLVSSNGFAKLLVDDLPIAGGVGGIPTFRYVVLYNATQTNPDKPLIGWWDYGQALTLLEGESITLDFADAAAGGALFIG